MMDLMAVAHIIVTRLQGNIELFCFNFQTFQIFFRFDQIDIKGRNLSGYSGQTVKEGTKFDL